MRTLRAFLLVCALATLTCAAARASCAGTYPYTLSNGTTADASQVMADFNAIMACATNIDNTQVGTLGFYASEIKPLTVGQATFGGSVGYIFGQQGPASVALTVIAANGQASDIFDVNAYSSASTYFSIAGNGSVVLGAPIAQKNATTDLLDLQEAATPTKPVLKVSTSTPTVVDQINAGGDLETTASGRILSWAPPVYVGSGVSTSNASIDLVSATLTFTALCNAGAVCATTTALGANNLSSSGFYCSPVAGPSPHTSSPNPLGLLMTVAEDSTSVPWVISVNVLNAGAASIANTSTLTVTLSCVQT